jgi:LAO/AO transport system kinase
MNSVALFPKLKLGNRLALSKAITLIESQKYEHHHEANSLLHMIADHRDTLRIGVCGPPGAGKSSLINSLSEYILKIDAAVKLAILAIDPSSTHSGGSILGDKTRMHSVLAHPRCFIRPSPSKGTYGGITASCAESIHLCESAGFNHVIIETVGLGQTETAIDDVCDVVILVTTMSGGDSL